MGCASGNAGKDVQHPAADVGGLQSELAGPVGLSHAESNHSAPLLLTK
jgi:hypothetical protein